jgi:pyrimidine operon attenuation protein / uracil phosphoribosyltransferase
VPPVSADPASLDPETFDSGPDSGPGSPPARRPASHQTASHQTASDQNGTVILDANAVHRALARIAHEILERNHGADDLLLLGIPTRGVYLAERIAAQIASFEHADVPVGSLDITMYRDDLRMRPARALEHTDIPPRGVEDAVVVLIDDVFFSGRTVRAALDALGDLGRPRQVQLAVLVDRGHRELPIRADFVGKNIPTSARQTVRVRLREHDDTDDQVVVVEDETPVDEGAPSNEKSTSSEEARSTEGGQE